MTPFPEQLRASGDPTWTRDEEKSLNLLQDSCTEEV